MGGMGEGDTQMTRVRTLLMRAFAGALLLLMLGAGVASADPGPLDGRLEQAGSGVPQILMLPEDPGL